MGAGKGHSVGDASKDARMAWAGGAALRGGTRSKKGPTARSPLPNWGHSLTSGAANLPSFRRVVADLAGHRKFSTLREKLTPVQRERARARVKELQTEMLLSELRKFAGRTQQGLADELGVSQPCLSKMEKQTDMQIGTLGRIVESLGGRLELIAHMPAGAVVLTQFTKRSS